MSHGNTPMDGFDNLSEETTDDRATNSTRILDSGINANIVNREEEMGTPYCIFIFVLFSFFVYLCWPLLLFGFIVYQLIIRENSSDMNSSVRRLSWSSPYCSCALRDAQEEGRVAQATDDGIYFALAPLDIQANDQPADPITIDMPHETNLHSTTEDLTQVLDIAMIDVTLFMSPPSEIPLLGDNHSNENNEQHNPILNWEMELAGNIERQEIDEIMPVFQNYSRWTQIGIANDVQTEEIGFVAIQQEVHDTMVNVDAPNDDALEALTADTLSIPIAIPTKFFPAFNSLFDNR